MAPILDRWRQEPPIREAAWIARCVGFAETSPLSEHDLQALAAYLEPKEFERGAPVFHAGKKSPGVWIVRTGMVELSIGKGRRKIVVQILRPGSVDGDIQLLLKMPLPYSARTAEQTRCLFIPEEAFERLLQEHPAVARRWLSSVAARVSSGQSRLVGMLGKSLLEQAARLLLEEGYEDRVPLPQRTLAAMLGVQRPSLNKVLRDLERRDLVKLGYGEITITDRAGLEKLTLS